MTTRHYQKGVRESIRKQDRNNINDPQKKHLGTVSKNILSPPVKVFFTDQSKGWFFCGSFLLVILHVGVCCAAMSVPCSLVVTCWERADLLAVVFKLLCFVTFPNVFWSISELRVRFAP